MVALGARLRAVPLLCLMALGAACPKKTTPPAPTGGDFTLAFTGGVRGWVEPCGCTVEPLGGIDRIHAELTRLRAAGHVLYVDAGDFLFDKPTIAPVAQCQEDARLKLLTAAARSSSLELTTVGPLDLSQGDSARATALDGINALSANVLGAANVKPGIIKDVGGVKVGLTGVTWPDDVALPSKPASPLPWHGLTLADPVGTLTDQVTSLRRQGAQVIVVLGQMSRSQLTSLLKAVPGVDLAILGHNPGETPMPPSEVSRGSWLLSAGAQGQHLGMVKLHVTDPGASCCGRFLDEGATRAESARLTAKIKQLNEQAAEFDKSRPPGAANAEARRKKALELEQQRAALDQSAGQQPTEGNWFSFEALALGSKVGSDGVMAGKLKEYKTSLAALNAQCEMEVTCAPAEKGAASYVGGAVCQQCHVEAVDFWKAALFKDPERAQRYKQTPGHPNPEGELGHARAWKTLEEAAATGNRDCVKCHSVGFEEPGGFCKTADGKSWGNVQCESCHGPGSKHADSEEARDIRLKVPEAHCRGCHQVPHITTTESFVYSDKLKIILGAGHGAARLQEVLGGK